jgi:epoxyqueuosine reductase
MNPATDKDLSKKIKDFAYSIGFDLIGIAPSRELTYHKTKLQKWLSAGMNADMGFLSRETGKRCDPALLLEGAKSVIVTGMSYYPAEYQGGNGTPVISRYVYGNDYHSVIGDKLKILLDYIISLVPGVRGKICVDSSPVLEKGWAREAGLGWIGKNSVIINRETGSFIFLGELVLDIELQSDKPFSEDLCGTCTLCLEACPTKAINQNKTIDARKCISWLTVENKNPIPEEFRDMMNDRIFGCDICQDVCPWNWLLKPHNNPDFELSERVKNMSGAEWASLSPDDFNLLFKKSSVKRADYSRLMSNIRFVQSGKKPSDSVSSELD